MADPITAEQAMQEGFDLHNMRQTAGWAIVVDEAEKRIDVALKALVLAKPTDLDTIYGLQHQIKALRWVIDWPATMAEQAQALEKEASQS